MTEQTRPFPEIDDDHVRIYTNVLNWARSLTPEQSSINEGKKSRRVSPLHLAIVYGSIRGRSRTYGVCFASIDTLVGETGISKNSVIRARQVLSNLGIIYLYKREGDDGNKTTIATLEKYPGEEVIKLVDALEAFHEGVGDEPEGLSPQGTRGLSPQGTRVVPRGDRGVVPPGDINNKDIKNNNNNVVVPLLEDQGITGKPLQEFEGISEERVRDVIAHAEGKPNPQGFIVSALRMGWKLKDHPPPYGNESSPVLEQERVEEQLIQREMEEEIDNVKVSEKELRDKIIDDYKIPEELSNQWSKMIDFIRSDSYASGGSKNLLKRLENSFLISFEDGVATILVEGDHNRDWLEDRAKSILRTQLIGHFGETADVRFEAMR